MDGARVKEQCVGEAGWDFVDVMGDENDWRGRVVGREFCEGLNEAFATRKVESRVRFIENEQPWFAH
jgi:hypothetical protein